MTSPTTPARVRLTITVTPDVHAAYTRLSKASGSSIGREMGDFLDATLEAVAFTASKMEQARESPATVMQELNAYAEGLAGGVATLRAIMGGGKGKARAGALVHAEPALRPPPSNTGGKVPRVNPKTGAKR